LLSQMLDSNVFQSWLKTAAEDKHAQVESAVNGLSQPAKVYGEYSPEFEFFSFGPEVFDYFSTAASLRESPLPKTFSLWKASQIRDLGLLLSEFRLSDSNRRDIREIDNAIRALLRVRLSAGHRANLESVGKELAAYKPL